MMLRSIPAEFRRYAGNNHPWRTAAILLLAYLVVYELAAYLLPDSVELHPATALALVTLFFGGIRLWPAVFLTALVGAVLAQLPILSIIAVPIAVTLQAVAGAYLLDSTRIDPLFRRYRDTFFMLGIILVISLISPSFEALVNALRHTSYNIVDWSESYTATLFCFLIITPFVLRWITKLRFRRTPVEMLEMVLIFAALIGIDYALFIHGISAIVGIPLAYMLLIPLFFISLRLRPRFVTLALFITSLFGIFGTLLHFSPVPLPDRFFGVESFMIAIAIIFYIVVSQEEDRRVTTGLIRSQVGTLENAVARIKSESNAKNDFIAILAHELRNPLAPIVSGIEVLRLKGIGDSEDAETLDIMADRITTVRRLLDDLLDISRITEGKIALKHETLELKSALERAIFSTDHHRKELHQSLSFKIPPTPLHIAGDPVRIEQIFSNLLTNASKYSNSGDTISLIVRPQDRIVEIEVSDKGVGIAPESLDTIFLPFQQIEQGKRSQKGLGIGLALVRNLVELHRGSVTAMSDGAGKGSRFIVRLPLLFSQQPAKVAS